MGGIHPSPRENSFTIGIFKRITSKYAKLMIELYICDNLNQTYRFLSLLTKKNFERESYLETS